MPLMPFQIVGIWLRGLFALALLGGAGYLLYDWYEGAHVLEVPRGVAEEDPPGRERPGPAPRGRWVFAPHLGFNRQTAPLAAGLALLGWSLAGWAIARGVAALALRAGADEPAATRGDEV